jgi:hypothetical protein
MPISLPFRNLAKLSTRHPLSTPAQLINKVSPMAQAVQNLTPEEYIALDTKDWVSLCNFSCSFQKHP